MPYLPEKSKTLVSKNGAWELEEYYSKLTPQDFAGHLNYLNYRIVKCWIKKNGKRYWIFALIVGTLICCVLEIYRRLVAPYEESAIKKNGDVNV
ncbi:MAG: DUF6899 family protein [Candidatus Helarchaeota archaeon]